MLPINRGSRPEERNRCPIAALQALDAALTCYHADGASLTNFLSKLHTAGGDVDAGTAPVIRTGPLEHVRRRVVQANQLLLERIGGEREAGIKFERLCKHLRGQRPAPTLELGRDDSVQIEDQERVGDKRNQGGDQENTPQASATPARSSHEGSLYSCVKVLQTAVIRQVSQAVRSTHVLCLLHLAAERQRIIAVNPSGSRPL